MANKTLEYLKAVNSEVSNFYKLSVTGYNGGGKFMEAKTKLFQKNTKEWIANSTELTGYPNLLKPKNTEFGKEENSPLVRLEQLKEKYIQPNPINLKTCSNGEIIDYLSRCRVARYGDCDTNAIEAALILTKHGKINKDYIHIIADQKWGHTYISIEPHSKDDFELKGKVILDPWANNVASNVFQRKIYIPSEENLSNGTPTLTKMEAAENFIKKKYNYQANEIIINNLELIGY